MSTVSDEDRLYVLVGIVRNETGQFLIQQRRPGTPKPGKWEFPGGKLEPGELPEQALSRELEEELGILVTSAERLTKLRYDYEHACVLLDTFLVNAWGGVAIGREGQDIVWASLEEISGFDVLEAVHPLLDAIRNRLAD